VGEGHLGGENHGQPDHEAKAQQSDNWKYWNVFCSLPAFATRLERDAHVQECARGIDLLAYDASARKFLGLQIKTLSRGRNAVPLGLRPHFFGDWWIIVTNVGNIAEDENPECFVLTPGEAKRGAVQDEGAPQAFWLPWDYYSKERFRKWDRIGRGDDAVRNSVRVSGGE
jgi:hypothetical protein